MGGQPPYFGKNFVRPVPLEVHIQGFAGKLHSPRMNSMNKPAYAAICTHSPSKPVLIFVSSRRQTRLTALDLIGFAASEQKPKQFLAMREESLQRVLQNVTDPNLKHTLQFGVGLHHAGLNDKDRSVVEELFARNKIQVLVCTSTLAWGVNLPEQLHDHFNAEVFSGTICNKKDAMSYLTWTYFFRRMAMNPAYYGLDGVESSTISSYLSNLVQTTFEDLEDSGCVKIDDDGRVKPTMLGSIASKYYLKYTTVSMFGSKIGPDTSLEGFLNILAAASEYDDIPVRFNLDDYNQTLAKQVRYRVPRNRLDDPHVKTNLLLQAHFSQLELISDYVTDLKLVLDPSIRIIQAMIDVCANSGWLSSALICMNLMQMVSQGIWSNSSSEDLQHFPEVQVQLGTDQNRGLTIRLEKSDSSRTSSKAMAKDEAWWLVLGNTYTSELHALKRVSFSDRLVTDMEMPVADFPAGLKLFLISDCYLNFQQEYVLP